MVCFPTPARAATASMVKPSNPCSRSSSRVAVTIAMRDFSLRRRGGFTGVPGSRSIGIRWSSGQLALHTSISIVACYKTRRFVLFNRKGTGPDGASSQPQARHRGFRAMTLGLTTEQRALSGAVKQFAGRHAPVAATRDEFAALATGQLPAWWDALVTNGFHAVHLPEHLGGQGGSLIDAACVLEAAAKALLPGPLLPTVTAGAVALLADTAPAAEALVRELASGAPAAVVLPGDGDFKARADGQRWLITGASEVVAGACSARVILLAAHTGDGEVVWVPVDVGQPTAAVEPANGTDLVGDVGILRLDDYSAETCDVLTGIDADRAACVVVGLVASTTAGISQWCVDVVTAHLRTREQFGKVIGTFQALQHSAAMILVNSELATAASWDAVRAADESLDQHRLAAAGAATIAVSPVPDLVLDSLTMF